MKAIRISLMLMLLSDFVSKFIGKLNLGLQETSSPPISAYLHAGTTRLDLSGKNISTLPPYGFINSNITYLDLSDNNLSFLDVNVFSGLFDLEVLILEGNRLCLPESYPDGVFKDLKSLKVLKTFSNDCSTKHTLLPDSTFGDLSGLEKLSLDAVDDLKFGPGFKKLTKLKELEVSSRQKVCDDYDISLRQDLFSNLPINNITHLTIRGCAFRNIDGMIFKNFSELTALNVACTSNIPPKLLFNAIGNMTTATLKTLILDGSNTFKTSLLSDILHEVQKFAEKYRWKILRYLLNKLHIQPTFQPFCSPKLKNIQRLSLRGTLLAHELTLEDNGQHCMPQLNHINLGGNPLVFVVYYSPQNSTTARSILEKGIPVERFWSLSNVRTVDVSNLFDEIYKVQTDYCKDKEQDMEQYFRKVPKIMEDVPDLPDFNSSTGYIKSKNITRFPPSNSLVAYGSVSPGTQVLFADNIFASIAWDLRVDSECPFVAYPFNTLAYVNISNNNFEVLNCPILGVESLRVLDVSYGRIHFINYNVSEYLPSLELLNARGNNFKNTSYLLSLFTKNLRLRELDISESKIASLPNNTFQELLRLEKLDLSHNILESIELNVETMKNLRLLDISFNLIPYLSKDFMTKLDSLFDQNASFELYLHGNPFNCSCSAIPFLSWLKKTNVSINNIESLTCIDSKTKLLEIDTTQLAKECKNIFPYVMYYIIIGGMATFIIAVVISGFVGYRKRGKIAWYIYTIKRRMFGRPYNILGELDADFQYWAYVAYSMNDNSSLPWVHELIDKVENEWKGQLFVFDRNADPAGSKLGETICGIQQSKKLIFVISESFLEIDFRGMLIHWAVMKGLNNVIMCFLEDLTEEVLPPEYAKVAIELQTHYPTNYIKFSTEVACAIMGDNNYWYSLKLALEELVENE